MIRISVNYLKRVYVGRVCGPSMTQSFRVPFSSQNSPRPLPTDFRPFIHLRPSLSVHDVESTCLRHSYDRVKIEQNIKIKSSFFYLERSEYEPYHSLVYILLTRVILGKSQSQKVGFFLLTQFGIRKALAFENTI